MSFLTIYKGEQDPWTGHTGPSINSVPSVAFKAYNTASGLLVLNDADQEMAGGLVSRDYPIPAGAKYFGHDAIVTISKMDFAHMARFEFDNKITFLGGAQANVSAQWKDGMWQLDPDGNGWVDSGFQAGMIADGPNQIQFRAFSDGTKWIVTGIRMNGDAFTPGSDFQNLLMIQTTWAECLHPQLQTEVQGAPWFLRVLYQSVWVMASDEAIPWEVGQV